MSPTLHLFQHPCALLHAFVISPDKDIECLSLFPVFGFHHLTCFDQWNIREHGVTKGFNNACSVDFALCWFCYCHEDLPRQEEDGRHGWEAELSCPSRAWANPQLIPSHRSKQLRSSQPPSPAWSRSANPKWLRDPWDRYMLILFFYMLPRSCGFIQPLLKYLTATEV